MAQQTYNFNVIVSCVVTTLTFTTSPPASTTVQVGIDTQPLTLPFAVTQPPACNITITFSPLPTTPAFVTLASITVTGGDVQVKGATITDHNTYLSVIPVAKTREEA